MCVRKLDILLLPYAYQIPIVRLCVVQYRLSISIASELLVTVLLARVFVVTMALHRPAYAPDCALSCY